MTKTTIGREPVQIVEIVQPLCANVFGTSPCTASGSADTKCYNTRATCQDAANFRLYSDGGITGQPDLVAYQGDVISMTGFDRSGDALMAADVIFDNDPSGVIIDLGGSAFGAYLGVSGADLVWRAGNGAASSTGTARITTPVTPFVGRSVLILFSVDFSASEVSLWVYDKTKKTVTSAGTAAASTGFGTIWTGTDQGGVGEVKGSSSVLGETVTNFTGTVEEFRYYDASAPATPTFESALSLYFSRGRVAERSVSGAPYIIPSLIDVSTSATKINLSGVNPDAQGLGNRALCNITFQDHPHTDARVDPYVSGRSWSGMDRGSFWSKWIQRNKFWNLTQINIYEGYAGEALSAMVKRTYYMDNITGPDDTGRVTIQGKDVLARLEERKAQAPEASPGELYAAISAVATSIEVSNAVETDYPETGIIRVGDEFISYSARATSANGITFTVTERGYSGTTASTHSAESEVQLCIEYVDQFADDVLSDLLQTYGGIPTGLLDLDGWEVERRGYANLVKLNAIIPEPTAVNELVSEILVQVGAYLWWDERDQLVKFRVIRGVTENPPLLSAEDNIMRGARIERLPRLRISQVWFYYNIRSYLGDLESPGNFFNARVVADLNSETEEQFGQPSVKKIYSRWLRTAAAANRTASRIARRYSEVPRQMTFTVDAKDRDYWTGDQIRISHYLDVDQYGERNIARWTIISAEEIIPGETVRYVCEDTTLYGLTYVIQATGAADYSAPADIDFNKAFIGDADGLLSDGTEAARIA
jgi:hypothetical protein